MEPTGKTSEEVEVPKLAENGRNWKIYCAKIIEAAATDITDPLGVLAGWQPDDGSYNWECLDAILKWTFYTTVPITILRPIWKLDTANEIFNYLAKRFRDPNPIVDPRTTSANDAKCDAHENLHTELRESPVSDDAATEWHANAKLDEEDLSNTQDVNGRNAGCTEDPHASLETLAEGNSTESTDGTLVLLTGTPCETRNEPQNSLRATPRRLPIVGEPCECEQEAANSVATAGCTNGMVERAEPTVADADINRTAMLGRNLVTETCGVDEGDETERNELRLQQTNLLCEEIRQHNENANENVPSAYGMPLEGEWAICASSKTEESESCERGMTKGVSVDEAEAIV